MRQLTILLCLLPTIAHARPWHGASGDRVASGELVDFDQRMIVIRDRDMQLKAIDRDGLSAQDNEYLDSPEAKDAVRRDGSENRAWQLSDGSRVRGRVIGYADNELQIRRQRGVLYVNRTSWNDLEKSAPRIATESPLLHHGSCH